MKSDDIAKIVGVSRSTVSKVINNYPDIPESTRIRVLKAIKEHGYFPDASARKLAGASNNTVGIFILDVKHEHTRHYEQQEGLLIYENTYFAPFINAVIDIANQNNYFALVSTIYSQADYERLRNTFYQKRVDGGILIGGSTAEFETIKEIITKGHILSLIDSASIDMEGHMAICINVDNEKGALDATQHLLFFGHKKIAIITGDLDKFSGAGRLAGFQKALALKGLYCPQSYVVEGDFTEISGYAAMKQLLALSDRPTAVFASNDSMAFGAYRACAEAGLTIPDDISIVGFDDAQAAKYKNPPLTTVSMPLIKMAEAAFNHLIEAISKGKQVGHYELVPSPLVVRQSVASPRK